MDVLHIVLLSVFPVDDEWAHAVLHSWLIKPTVKDKKKSNCFFQEVGEP